MNCLILAMGICFLTIFSSVSLAQDGTIGLYSNCYFGDDFSNRQRENIRVSPIGLMCQERCNNECGSMITAEQKKGVSLSFNTSEFSRCVKDCRAGLTGVVYKIKTKDANGSLVTSDRKIKIACSKGHTDPVAIDKDITVADFKGKKDESFFIRLQTVPNFGYGRIALCGVDNVILNPDEKSLGGDRIIDWGPKNAFTTDTTIDMKDGDFVSIKIETVDGKANKAEGEYLSNFNLYLKTTVNSGPGGVWDGNGTNSGNFSIINSTELTVFRQNSDGEYVDYYNGNVISDPGKIFVDNSKVKFFGLMGKVDTATVMNDQGEIDESQSFPVIKYEGQLNGYSDSLARLGLLHYAATFNNRLQLGSSWLQNTGGLRVTIDKEGCVYQNGERLQYTILKETANSTADAPIYNDPYDKKTQWTDLTKAQILEREPIKFAESGKLAFRIKPLVEPEASPYKPKCNPNNNSQCKSSLDKYDAIFKDDKVDRYYYLNGEYKLTLEKDIKEKIQDNLITDIVFKVRQYLLGGNGEGGIVQTLFNKFVQDSRFVDMISAAVVLFMSWTGLSYLVGLTPLSARDALIRIVSLALVLTLTRPNSWEFFNTQLFGLFINGGGVLIANMIDYNSFGIAESEIEKVATDSYMVFGIFDKVFNIIFSSVIWIKILALTFSGWMGFYLAFAILVGVLLFSLALIKTFIIYMVSMVMLAILLLLAPLFITFLLFKYTRKMFMSWLGQLISVTLQPVVIIVSLAIFTNLFLAGLFAALGFSVCKTCFLGFALPVVLSYKCLIPGWMTVNIIHAPDDAILASPITNMAACFYIFIIAHAMYIFIGQAIMLVNAIVSQNFFTGINLAGYANIQDYTTNVVGRAMAPVNFALGRSDGVRAARQGINAGASRLARSFEMGQFDKRYSKVSEALKEVAQRTGTKLSDEERYNLLKKLGAEGKDPTKLFADSRMASLDKMQDKAALLEKSEMSKAEIVQAFLKSTEKDGVSRVGMKTTYDSLRKGEESDRLKELLEKAKKNISGVDSTDGEDVPEPEARRDRDGAE